MDEKHLGDGTGTIATIAILLVAILAVFVLIHIYRTWISPSGREKQRVERLALRVERKANLKSQISDLDRKIGNHESNRSNLSSNTDMYWHAGQQLPKLREKRKLLKTEIESIELEGP